MKDSGILFIVNIVSKVFFILIILIVGIFFRDRCPSCNKFRAVEKLEDRLIGVFRKAEKGGSMYAYGKHKIDYKCKYCGHEWTVYEIRRY